MAKKKTETPVAETRLAGDCEEMLLATQDTLRLFVDDVPCIIDGSGQCTTVEHNAGTGPCPVAQAREVLGMDENIALIYTPEDQAVLIASSPEVNPLEAPEIRAD